MQLMHIILAVDINIFHKHWLLNVSVVIIRNTLYINSPDRYFCLD